MQVICPKSDDCKSENCHHSTVHHQEMHPLAAYYCGKGSNGCPACVATWPSLKFRKEFLEYKKEAFTEEEFQL